MFKLEKIKLKFKNFLYKIIYREDALQAIHNELEYLHSHEPNNYIKLWELYQELANRYAMFTSVAASKTFDKKGKILYGDSKYYHELTQIYERRSKEYRQKYYELNSK